METLDCRSLNTAEAESAIVQRFNEMSPGALLEIWLDAYPTSLKTGLLEGGMIPESATQSADGSWRLAIERRLCPAQGSAPVRGVHHIIANAQGSVWTCQRAPLVARIDGDTGRVRAVAAVARRGSHLALAEDGRRIFVADPEAGQVIALRAEDLAIEDRWDAPGGPQLPLASPDGIVCVTGSRTGSLTLARPVGGTFAAQTIAIGKGPHDPVLSSDGSHLFVPCMGDGVLAKVRLDDGRIVGRCSVGDGPAHLVAHPADDRLYVANSWDGTVTCVTEDGEIRAQAESGGWAHAIAITPDGSWLWVSNFLDDTVALFKADTLERVAVLETDPYPHGVDVSPDGRFVVVPGYASEYARVFDAASGSLLARAKIGRGGSHTAFAGGGKSAFIACSVDDHVASLDLTAGTVSERIAIH